MIWYEVEPVDYYCRACDSAMEDTRCDARYCAGYRCLGCSAGCDHTPVSTVERVDRCAPNCVLHEPTPFFVREEPHEIFLGIGGVDDAT